jgi:hypothetical protein
VGFFSGIIHGITNTVKQITSNPLSLAAKSVTTVATGGLSTVLPKTFSPVTGAVQSTLFNPALVGKVAAFTPVGKIGSLALPSLPSLGGSNVGLNLSGIIGGLTSGIGALMGGASPSTALGNFSSFLPSMGNIGGGAPPLNTNPFSFNTMASMPAAGRAAATVGRSLFARYPNLATYIQQYRNMGKHVTRAKLYSLMKRFGPELLVSGGILSAAAISELMMAGPGRRRMNPGNVKALRRSLRRLESFHHLCGRVDKLRSRRRSSTKSKC